MSFPKPVPGLVIRYSYLWRKEYLSGREEGVKDRPCAVILVTQDLQSGPNITVLPVTHSSPREPKFAIEIPTATKARLGLDFERSWIVLNEANRFVWPGPDLRPLVSGDVSSVGYGLLPRNFFFELRDRFVAILKSHQTGIVARTE